MDKKVTNKNRIGYIKWLCKVICINLNTILYNYHMYNYLPTYKDYSMLGIIGIALGLTCYYVMDYLM